MRVFLGFHLPAAVNGALRHSLPLQTWPDGVRWHVEQDRHMTLLFMGEVPSVRIPALILALEAFAWHEHQVIRWCSEQIASFPNDQHVATWALEGSVPGPLLRLVTALRHHLANWYPEMKQPRGFRAHVSLARMRVPMERPIPLALECHLSQVCLFRSEYGRGEQCYDVLASWRLAK